MCFKKQLSLCWYLNDKMQELRAYDNLGMANFYKQVLDKANYYHIRAMNGILEPDDSFAKQLIVKHYKNKVYLSEIESIRDNFQLMKIMKSDKTKLVAGNVRKEMIKNLFKLEPSGDYILSGIRTLDEIAKSVAPSPASNIDYQR